MSGKVFGLGLSRTGTQSLGCALVELGKRTIHFPNDAVTQVELGNGKLSILESYDAIVDIPTVPFYRSLDVAYPGSKFVLTVRAKGSWLRSCREHMVAVRDYLPLYSAQTVEFIRFILWRVYGTTDYDEGLFSAAYDRHLEDMTGYFHGRPDDLLVMDIFAGDGWDVLCRFLGCDSPAVPFPHFNRSPMGAGHLASVRMLRAAIMGAVPSGEAFVFADQDELAGLVDFGDREAIPLADMDGQRFVAFAWTAFRDDYPELSGFQRIVSNDQVIVFKET